jgi:hypothetical protein
MIACTAIDSNSERVVQLIGTRLAQAGGRAQ